MPRTVTCMPAGCHGWRRPLDRERPPTVAAGGGLVVVVDADRATGVDAATGQERWVAPLDDLLPTTAGGTRLSDLVGRERPYLAVDADLVLIGTTRRVAALDRSDGARRWVARSTGWRLEELTLLDGAVVLRERPRPTDEQDEAGRPRRVQPITVLDRADGTVRWQSEVAELIDVGDGDGDGDNDGHADGDSDGGLTVVVDDTLQGVDPTTGYVRWRRSWSSGAYVFRAGPWLITEGSQGHRLLDPATGLEVADLDGYLAHGVLEVGELTVSVLLQPEPGAAPTSHAGDLVALAADGTTVWRQPYGFAAPMRCCATLLPWEGGLAVLGLRGERELLDLATGDPREEAARLPLDGPARIAADGTLVGEPVGDLAGVPALTTVAPDGQVTNVAGPELTIVGTDPLVVRGSGELVGVLTARGE
jgi:outer membrane protein assembly factor BamB